MLRNLVPEAHEPPEGIVFEDQNGDKRATFEVWKVPGLSVYATHLHIGWNKNSGTTDYAYLRDLSDLEVHPLTEEDCLAIIAWYLAKEFK